MAVWFSLERRDLLTLLAIFTVMAVIVVIGGLFNVGVDAVVEDTSFPSPDGARVAIITEINAGATDRGSSFLTLESRTDWRRERLLDVPDLGAIKVTWESDRRLIVSAPTVTRPPESRRVMDVTFR